MDYPWFPFYPGDFLSSRTTKVMDATQVGIYLLLLMDQWSGGPLPAQPDELATIARAPWPQVEVVLLRCFQQDPDGWVNLRLEKVRAEQVGKRARRVAAGRLGGSARARQPTQEKHHPQPISDQCSSNAQAMLEQTPSSQSQSQKKKQSQKKQTDTPPHTPPQVTFDVFWAEYPLKEGKKAALRAWNTRTKTVDPGVIMEGLARYKAKLQAEATPPRYIRRPATFLGPDEWWKEAWVPQVTPVVEERTIREEDVTRLQARFAGTVPDIRPRVPHPSLAGPQSVGQVLAGFVIPKPQGEAE